MKAPSRSFGGTLPKLFFLALVLGSASCGFALRARVEQRPQGNLVPRASVTGVGIAGHARTAADQFFPEEGTRWDASSMVRLSGPSAWLDIDFGAVVPVTALVIEADGDDYYAVEGSADGTNFLVLWTAPPVSGTGARLRSSEIDAANVRYLRVRALGGDGKYSVGELMALCVSPGQDLLVAGARAAERRPALTYDRCLVLKLFVAASAASLFLWGWVVRLRRRGGAGPPDWALAALSVTSAVCWWNFGAFHFDRYVHREDMFHYFVGSKYFEELGYDGLYACTAAADAEAGFESWVRGRVFRDLRTNEVISGAAALEQASAHRRNFSPGRWDEFERDLAWFRTCAPPPSWERMTLDHGYNATPTWGVAARLLSRNLEASDGAILALALIDPVLLAAAGAALAWTFGWRAAAVAAIFWGTNLPAEFAWTGGSFLRQDWLLATVGSVCLARRGRWTAAGVALALAASLRVYPVFLAAGLGMKTLGSMLSRRSLSLDRNHRRFALGFLAAVASLLALSSAAAPGGAASWSRFAQNSRVDLSSRGSNQVGLEVLLARGWSESVPALEGAKREDAARAWQESRSRALSSRRWVQALVLAAFSALFLIRVRGADDWEALVLGVGFLPLAVSIASYYASLFLLYGLLWERRRESAALVLTALAAWTQCAMLLWGREDIEGIFFGVSAGVVIAVLLLTASPPGGRALSETHGLSGKELLSG